MKPKLSSKIAWGSLAVAALAVGAALTAGSWRQAPTPAAPAASFYGTAFERRPDAAELTALGRRLFFDPSLSVSGRMSCASCHDPARAYGPPNDLAVQLGGPALATPGIRAVPSLMYKQDTPPFDEHYTDTDGDDSIDQGPAGGRGWDGSTGSAHEQAEIPLLSPFEMGNADRHAAVARLRDSPHAGAMRQAFGPGVLDSETLAWNAMVLALEVFQQSPTDFYPYSSKYDAWLRREVELSPAEERGLALFNDPAKGNCAECHPSAIRRGAFPQFTDHGLIALALPRNDRIPANADPGYFDLGLCGPVRTDLAGRPEYCGLFKTPTLRNVATRGAYFHNGVFHTLEDSVRFYAERDARPAGFYGRDAGGKARPFDDLPAAYRDNVNREAPFGQSEGAPPSLSAAEQRDIVAFLRTLSDGYAATPSPARSSSQPVTSPAAIGRANR